MTRCWNDEPGDFEHGVLVDIAWTLTKAKIRRGALPVYGRPSLDQTIPDETVWLISRGICWGMRCPACGHSFVQRLRKGSKILDMCCTSNCCVPFAMFVTDAEYERRDAA